MKDTIQVVLTNCWVIMEMDIFASLIYACAQIAILAGLKAICQMFATELVSTTNQLREELPCHPPSSTNSFVIRSNPSGGSNSQVQKTGERAMTENRASTEQINYREEVATSEEATAKEKMTARENTSAGEETTTGEQIIAVEEICSTEEVAAAMEANTAVEITSSAEWTKSTVKVPTRRIDDDRILRPINSQLVGDHASDEHPDDVKSDQARKFQCLSSGHNEEDFEEYKQTNSEKSYICSPDGEDSDEEMSQAPSTDDVMSVQDCSDLDVMEATDETDNSLYHNNEADYTTSTHQQDSSISPNTNIQLPEGEQTDAVKETGNPSHQDVNLFNTIHNTDIYNNDAVVQAAVEDSYHGDCEKRQFLETDTVRSDTNVDRSCSDPSAVMDDMEGCERTSDTQPCRLQLGEKMYNLETASAADECMTEYTEIPSELNDLIADICSDEDVSSAMVYQSPSNSKELLVVGVGANKNVEAKLQAAVQNDFPEFTIYTDCIKHHLEHTNPYANKKAFTAYKEQLDKDDKTYSDVSRATCELVLEGQAMADRLHASTSIYALLPAHFVLGTEDCKLLTSPQDHEAGRKHVQEIIIAKVVNSRYRLSMLHPAKIIKLRPDDLMYSYRPHQQEDHGGPMHFSSFYNDLYLLEIEKSFFFERKETLINLPDLEDGMKTTPDGKAIGEILPVMSNAQLVQMGVGRVKVEVGSSTGYMTWAGIPVQQKKRKEGVVAERNDKPQAFHAQFIIEDRPLMPGHSGSIVYVIDTTSKVRYRFGMLFGEAKRAHKNTVTVFQALVLQQGIAELEHRYSHKVKDLRPLASSDSSIGEGFSPIWKRLEKYGSSSSIDLVKERKEMSEVKVSTVRPVSATTPVTANRLRETEMNSSHAEEGFGSGQLETGMAADQSVMEGGERTSHSIGLDSSALCEPPESHLPYSSTTSEDQMSDLQQTEKQSLPSDNLGDSGFESVANQSMDNLSGTSLPDNQ